VRIETSLEPSGNSSHVSLGGRHILFWGEEKRHIDGYTRENGFFDRHNALSGTRDLYEQVGPLSPGMQLRGGGDCAGSVGRQQWRYLQ
jgi:hypothetical protein